MDDEYHNVTSYCHDQLASSCYIMCTADESATFNIDPR